MNRLLLTVALAGAWCLMWGSIRPADVLGGLAAAAAVQVFVPRDTLPVVRRVRPGAMLVFLARFALDLVLASATVAVQAFWPRGRWRTRVMAVQLTSRDATVLTIVGNAITLTPGTLTLEVDAPAGRLLVHALHSPDGADVVAAARRYERLVAAALPGPRPKETA